MSFELEFWRLGVVCSFVWCEIVGWEMLLELQERCEWVRRLCERGVSFCSGLRRFEMCICGCPEKSVELCLEEQLFGVWK